MAKWIAFRELPQQAERKTTRWLVVAKEGADELGIIRWYGRWRCYSFEPNFGTIYEKVCLRDIAQFCEDQTRARRRAVTGLLEEVAAGPTLAQTVRSA